MIIEPSDDIRSYHIDSSKSKKILGFKPKYDVNFAINELCEKIQKKEFIDTFDTKYFNVKHLLANKVI